MGTASTPAWAARFTGRFFAPEPGTYTFQVNAQSAATLQIDGKNVSGGVELTAGGHELEVLYYKAAGAAALEILWVQPNGVGTPSPMEGLSAIDPALAAITNGEGTFSIVVPARIYGLRVVAQLPDGRIARSAWAAPLNGEVTGLGDIVVSTKEAK
jgi:hypothetical protein